MLAAAFSKFVRDPIGSALWFASTEEPRPPPIKGWRRIAAQNSNDAARKTADQCGPRRRSIDIRQTSVAIQAQMRPLCSPTKVPCGKVEASFSLLGHRRAVLGSAACSVSAVACLSIAPHRIEVGPRRLPALNTPSRAHQRPAKGALSSSGRCSAIAGCSRPSAGHEDVAPPEVAMAGRLRPGALSAKRLCDEVARSISPPPRLIGTAAVAFWTAYGG